LLKLASRRWTKDKDLVSLHDYDDDDDIALYSLKAKSNQFKTLEEEEC
jgi:hypothetical protein